MIIIIIIIIITMINSINVYNVRSKNDSVRFIFVIVLRRYVIIIVLTVSKRDINHSDFNSITADGMREKERERDRERVYPPDESKSK